MKKLTEYRGWALVTGASSGIGMEFARQIAAQGVDCVLVARRRDRLQSLADELRSRHGVEVHCVELDLAGVNAPERLVEATAGKHIGILVNNAGIGYAGPFETRSAERMDALVTLNCRVPVALTRAYLPAMIEDGKGAIILVSSVLGFLPAPYDAVYGASKAFDLYFGEALWAELRGTGVDAITLCPSTTRTEFFETEGRTAKESAAILRVADEPAMVAGLALKYLGRRATIAPWSSFGAATLARFLPRQVVAGIMRTVMRTRVKAHEVE